MKKTTQVNFQISPNLKSQFDAIVDGLKDRGIIKSKVETFEDLVLFLRNSTDNQVKEFKQRARLQVD
jgi:hypothetical protein